MSAHGPFQRSDPSHGLMTRPTTWVQEMVKGFLPLKEKTYIAGTQERLRRGLTLGWPGAYYPANHEGKE